MGIEQKKLLVSLFCGSGGMDLGFAKVGFVPVLALDKDSSAISTYNWNRRRNIAKELDLTKISGNELVRMVKEISGTDLPRGVIGGPPCQSFSHSNVHKKNRDRRARLGSVFARLVQSLNLAFGLDFVVFENVIGLRSNRHLRVFRSIKRELRRAGFNIFVGDLDAGDFGVAQHRRRLLIVGINQEKFPWANFVFPDRLENARTARQVIGTLPAPMFYQRGLKPKDIAYHPNHWTMNPRSAKFRRKIHSNGRSFRRLRWDRPSYTVAYGNREIHVHPSGKRRLSVLEAMLIQGFPKSYEIRGSLSAQVSQVSNAVPPPLSKAVALAIKQSVYAPVKRLQSLLLRWSKGHQRSFPWRKARDPFRILLAEKLLQQTAATDAVVTAFRQIVHRFPDWNTLAKAPIRELRKILRPLGLLYRAQELVRLARFVARSPNSIVPHDLKGLLSLPGVGEYSARAVLSFSFQKPIAVVDTNVARFLVRYFGLKINPSQNPARDRRLHRIADALVPERGSREFNFAILDLCAAHCRAKKPICETCPVRSGCNYWNNRSKKSAETGIKTV